MRSHLPVRRTLSAPEGAHRAYLSFRRPKSKMRLIPGGRLLGANLLRSPESCLGESFMTEWCYKYLIDFVQIDIVSFNKSLQF